MRKSMMMRRLNGTEALMKSVLIGATTLSSTLLLPPPLLPCSRTDWKMRRLDGDGVEEEQT
jgi:hypothetical protein